MLTEKLSYRFEGFEGPLDLLLTLIAKNKMNIYDISIHQLLEQYMAQIDAMNRENMDVASAFLEMAARLVHMKSVSLLPRQEEAEKLRMELTGQLIEYRQCKLAAAAALLYGETCAIVKPAYGMLFSRVNCKEKSARVDLDYQADVSKILFDCQLHIQVIFLLREGLRALKKGLPIIRRLK